MEIKVKKRDAASVEYDESKIYIAIEKAVLSTSKNEEEELPPHLATIIKDITGKLDNIIKGYEKGGKDEIDVETIQDLVEQQLMGAGLYDVARAYILYREEHKKARNQPQPIFLCAFHRCKIGFPITPAMQLAGPRTAGP